MKKFIVKQEHIDDWYGSMSAEEIETTQAEGITLAEIEDLADGWCTTTEYLLEQVEEIEVEATYNEMRNAFYGFFHGNNEGYLAMDVSAGEIDGVYVASFVGCEIVEHIVLNHYADEISEYDSLDAWYEDAVEYAEIESDHDVIASARF